VDILSKFDELTPAEKRGEANDTIEGTRLLVMYQGTN